MPIQCVGEFLVFLSVFPEHDHAYDGWYGMDQILDIEGDESSITNAKARRLLGWEPERSWRE